MSPMLIFIAQPRVKFVPTEWEGQLSYFSLGQIVCACVYIKYHKHM